MVTAKDLVSKEKRPMYMNLYRAIKKDINNGELSGRLPSKRVLAEHLGVSVITVEYAYRQLLDEGYIYSRERSGYFVCAPETIDMTREKPLYERKIAVEKIEQEINDFPFSTLSKIMRRVLSQYGESLLIKPPHKGCAILRNAISEYLARYRGISADPHNIVIGSGAEQLYSAIVIMLGRDIVYGIENPSYEKIKAVYESNGAVCELLDMGGEGIKDDCLSKSNAKVLHVTPFHSYPTVITAPASKRFKYIAWAKARDGIIVEDDFDSETPVSGRPVETIYSMDGGLSVIYLNTFSKSLAPSMRMGYMVLPDKLNSLYEEKLGFYSCTVPVFDQYVLAEFIAGGHFERHLNRKRRKQREMLTY